MMRLTSMMGRHEAHHWLYEAAQRCQSEGIPFITAIREHELFADREFPSDLAQALVASDYVGESASMTIDTVRRITGL